MVGQRTLDPSAKVRILPPQPRKCNKITSDGRVRSFAVCVFKPNIAKLEAKRDVRRLAKALWHKNVWVGVDAAKALGNIGPDARAAIPALMSVLDQHGWWRSGDEELFRNVTIALGNIGPDAKEAVPLLINMLRLVEQEARSSLVRIMGTNVGTNVGNKATAKHEAEAYASSIEDKCYCNHVYSGEHTYSDAVEKFKEMSPRAKRYLLPYLIDLLKIEDRDVLIDVCCVLAAMRTRAKAAVPALIDALQDENALALEQVVYALGAIGPSAKAAVPALINVLKVEDTTEVCIKTAIALGNIGADARDAIPDLTEMLNDDRQWAESTPTVSYYASEAIKKIKKADQEFNL